MLEFKPLYDFAGHILANYELGRENHEEMQAGDLKEYSPDVDRYALMEHSGILIAVGAFDGTKIVGYAVAVVATHSHCTSMTMALSDMLFLRKEYRKGRNGLALVGKLREACKARGAAVLLWTARTDTPFYRMLLRQGLQPLETVFADPL